MSRLYSHSLRILSYGECQDKSRPIIVSGGNFTSTSDILLDADHKSRIAQANQSIDRIIDARYMSTRVDITVFRKRKNIGRRDSVRSTYGLVNYEHFF
jgi:hypothetical protein